MGTNSVHQIADRQCLVLRIGNLVKVVCNACSKIVFRSRCSFHRQSDLIMDLVWAAVRSGRGGPRSRWSGSSRITVLVVALGRQVLFRGLVTWCGHLKDVEGPYSGGGTLTRGWRVSIQNRTIKHCRTPCGNCFQVQIAIPFQTLNCLVSASLTRPGLRRLWRASLHRY